MKRPYYQKIYKDYIAKYLPEKQDEFDFFFRKKEVNSLDVIRINKMIVGTVNCNTKYASYNRNRSYKKSDILTILEYQKRENLNNTQLAAHFNLSRNTVAQWKKLFQAATRK